MSEKMMAPRIEWIDWMKTIGIYFIVLGHFFPLGDKYIYAFSVPLFFVISGFLCKKEPEHRVFWKKIFSNLIIPMLIIVSVNFLYDCMLALIKGGIDERCNVIKWGIKLCLGFHGALGNCWFIYTLVVMKIVFQISSNKIFYAIVVLCILLSYIYNAYLPSLLPSSNSIVNVTTAFPFFAFGVYVNKYKLEINALFTRGLAVWSGYSLLFSSLLFFISATFNDYVWMYLGKYGRYMSLFLIGGITGTFIVFAISKLLGQATWYVKKISSGTIIILGFHSFFIKITREFIEKSVFDYFMALIIVLLFIPIIIIAEKYFPILLGKYRLKK